MRLCNKTGCTRESIGLLVKGRLSLPVCDVHEAEAPLGSDIRLYKNEAIYRTIRDRPGISRSELMAIVNCDSLQLGAHISRLRSAKRIHAGMPYRAFEPAPPPVLAPVAIRDPEALARALDTANAKLSALCDGLKIDVPQTISNAKKAGDKLRSDVTLYEAELRAAKAENEEIQKDVEFIEKEAEEAKELKKQVKKLEHNLAAAEKTIEELLTTLKAIHNLTGKKL